MPSYLVLARKYRPAFFSDVIGQNHVIQTLSNSIISGRVAHAFLFSGVRGVGKTTVARILAKALNCSGREEGLADPCNRCSSCTEINRGISVDVQEIDGASNTSVDNIRDINENIKYPPVSSPYKIIIIDEVHMISVNAFNALLKTLEEPPSHAKFIFATTEAHKVPATINSRCQRFNFRTIASSEIAAGMEKILESEGVEVSSEGLSLIAREAQGSFRDALSLLDQVLGFGSGPITYADVLEILGVATRDNFRTLVKALLNRDSVAALSVLNDLFQRGHDPEQLIMELIRYIRDLIVMSSVPVDQRAGGMIDATASEIKEMEELAAEHSTENLQNLFSILMRSEAEVRRSLNPWIILEITCLRMIHAPDIVDLSALLHHIDERMLPQKVESPSRKDVNQPRSTKNKLIVKEEKAVAVTAEGSPRTDESAVGLTSERFIITGITPLPSGSPDEVWADLKTRIGGAGADRFLLSIMDHGSLISFGEKTVEIGFNKAFYKQEFESRLQARSDIRLIFQELFGNAAVKVLTLASETSLATPDAYALPDDGQTDFDRALKNEAIEHPITRAILAEFQDGTIEGITVLSPKS